MTTIDIEQLVAFVDKMPAFRSSVQRLLHLAADINADNREIVHVIESDPLMTVKVLKVVNSPFYGLAQKISSVQRAVVLFISAFVVIWLIMTILLAATGLDLMTALTGALTSLTNVGPGLGDQIGPSGNFANVPDSAKWLLSLAMLLGRLEILAVLVIFTPAFWSR